MIEQGTTKDWLKRPRCKLLGCYLGEQHPTCYHCGEYLYEDFIQAGKLEPLFRLYYRIRQWFERPRLCREEGCLLPRGHSGDHDDVPF